MYANDSKITRKTKSDPSDKKDNWWNKNHHTDEGQKRVFSFTDNNKGEGKIDKSTAERRELCSSHLKVSISLKEKNMVSEDGKDEIWKCEEQKRFETVTIESILHWLVISKIIMNAV